MAKRKNPAAVSLGRRGGSANTNAQKRARAKAKPGAGRPREPLACRKCGRSTKKRDASRRPDCGCK